MKNRALHRARISHRAKQFLFGILYGIFVLILLTNSFIQTRFVQNYLAHKASEILTDKLGIAVHIEKLHLSLMMDITLEGVTMKDLHQNDMVVAEYLHFSIEGIDLQKSKFSLSKLRLENSGFVLRKYENEEHYNISMIFPPDPTDTSVFVFPARITCGNAMLKNCFFQLINDQKEFRADFDHNHIDLQIETMKADKILISDEDYSFRVNKLQVHDTSGLTVKNMTAMMKFLPDGWYMDQLKLETPTSDMDLDLKFAYSTFDNISEFIDSVRIISTIRPSTLDIQDVAYFTSSLDDFPIVTQLEGTVDGFVNDLQINNLKLNFANSTEIITNAYLNGIMEPETASMKINLQRLHTTLADIQSMPSIFGEVNLPAGIIDTVVIEGDFSGTISDFNATAKVHSSCGSANMRVKMWDDADFGDYQYYGFLTASNLHTTPPLGLEDLYKAQSVHLNFEGFGTSLDNVKLEINGEIDKIYAFGYEYDTLSVSGTLSKGMFQGNIDLDDKNIGLDFNGLVTFDKDAPVFDFTTSLRNVYLSRLGLLPDRPDDSHLSLDLAMKLKGDDIEHLLGLVELDDVVLEEQDSIYNFGDFKIGTYEQMMGNRKIIIRSDIVDANFEGDFQLTEMEHVISYFSSIYLPSYDQLMSNDTTSNDFDGYNLAWDLSLKNITPVTRWLLPDLAIPNGLFLNGKLDLEDSIFSIDGKAPTIQYMDFVGNNWTFSNHSENEYVTLSTGFEQLVLDQPNEDDSLGITRQNIGMKFEMFRDTVNYFISWDNISSDSLHYLINGFCDLAAYPATNFHISDIYAPIHQSFWDISDDNYITIDSNLNIDFHNVRFSSDSSYLMIAGFLSNDSTQSTDLQLDMKYLDLSIFNIILNNYDAEAYGLVSGNANYKQGDHHFSFFSDIVIDDLNVNHNKMGDVLLESKWDAEKEAIYLNLESSISNIHGMVKHPLQLKGYLNTNDSTNFFDLSMNLDNIRLAILNPFINDFVEQTSGFLSGNATLKGSLKEPDVEASIKMSRCEALIKYTNVLYYFTGSIDVDENIISFHNLTLNDSLGGKATIDGGIKHHNFSDFVLDVDLHPTNFQLLNTNRLQNDIFYGKAVVSGDINVDGPFNDINISAFVRTNQGTDVAVPISSAMSVDENTYVIFKSPQNDSAKINKMKSSIVGLTLSLRMMMTPEGQVRIFLPGDLGNISANGKGLITLGLNKRGDFSIAGTYVLDGGRFLLNLENIISKKFEINKGSSITFNGDPMEADLNVSATYGTRTSLSGLGLALDSTALQQRTNVDCILRMTESLSDPQISFSIDFPGQSDEFKQTIFSQLDTTNEVLMTQQAFSLLVVNSFSFKGSESSLGSTMASSGVTMITNQINGWLSQLSKDVNIGINYRPGDKMSSDEVGLALSTQLFNNRVSIDANVGYVEHSVSSSRSSNVVGDITVEVKITKDGRFTTKVFSRSNANDISKIGTSSEEGYTYGIGINYRKNFDKFSEIFRRSPEEKKQQEQKKENRLAQKEAKKEE